MASKGRINAARTSSPVWYFSAGFGASWMYSDTNRIIPSASKGKSPNTLVLVGGVVGDRTAISGGPGPWETENSIDMESKT